jgi:hypothetical protein
MVIALTSASLMSGVNAPTKSKCVPGCNHSPQINPSVARVALEIRSDPRTNVSRFRTGVTGHFWANSWASFCAASGDRFQISTRSNRCAEMCASSCARACGPAPTIPSTRASEGIKYRAASAETAAVRRSVMARASITASSSPVASFCST